MSGYGNYGASPEQYPIDAGRLRRVLEIAAEKSGWGKRKPGAGTGWGLAVHRSFVTYVASVVQVEVNDKGEIKIPRVDTVVDAGMIVNPQFVKAQFEGAAVFGTSIARTGEITASDGAVDQSNFHDYPVARIAEAPYETNVYIVESTGPPAVSESLAYPHSCPRSATRSTQRPEYESEICRSREPTWGSKPDVASSWLTLLKIMQA